jgi:hypothetical protein
VKCVLRTARSQILKLLYLQHKDIPACKLLTCYCGLRGSLGRNAQKVTAHVRKLLHEVGNINEIEGEPNPRPTGQSNKPSLAANEKNDPPLSIQERNGPGDEQSARVYRARSFSSMLET